MTADEQLWLGHPVAHVSAYYEQRRLAYRRRRDLEAVRRHTRRVGAAR